MAYCDYEDVRRIINCPQLENADITDMILASDAEINKRIGTQTAGDELIKKLSYLLTAQTIKGRYPDAITIGQYTEQWENIQEVWDKEIEKIYRLYKSVRITSTGYQVIDEDDRYEESTVRVK